MTTKIFVSQIDSTQPDGSTASQGLGIILGSTGPYWGTISNNGYTGSAGYRGSIGYQGSAGANGIVGAPGYLGSTGYQGSLGVVGYQGSPGTGTTGYFGSTGYRGSLGQTGYLGSLGYTGSTGNQGLVGYQGSLGAVGYAGSAGVSNSRYINLTDGPNSYTGASNKVLTVNAAGTGVIFTSNLAINAINTSSASVGNLSVTAIATDVNFQSYKLANTVFKGYGEYIYDYGDSGTDATFQASGSNVAKITLNQPVVTIVLGTDNITDGTLYSITFFLKQDGVGGRVIDWTNNIIYWPVGDGVDPTAGPTLSTAADVTDIITVSSYDGGATWFGSMAGKGYQTP
jgi:hypothetical protein